MSVGVISLSVWLILIFISVTNGIEKSWLKKLTSLNAPIRIVPTSTYYRSYYYQIDVISNASEYKLKNINQKVLTNQSDPYDIENDMEVPLQWPKKVLNEQGSIKDFVKEAFETIENLGLIAQEYEVSGAVLKLNMTRQNGAAFSSYSEPTQGYLTQVSYITSFNDKSPELSSLIDSPRLEDLNHLFFLADICKNKINVNPIETSNDAELNPFQKEILSLLSNIEIERIQSTSPKWYLSSFLLPDEIELDANIIIENGKVSYFSIPVKKGLGSGKLIKNNNMLVYRKKNEPSLSCSVNTPLYIEGTLNMDAQLNSYNINKMYKKFVRITS